MTLKTRLNDATKTAMKARNLDEVKVLRNFLAVVKQLEIDRQETLNDADILTLLQKQLKQRRESLAIFQANARDDLAQKEQGEIDVLSVFLPEQLNQEALLAVIEEVRGDLGSEVQMGALIKAVKDKTAGTADPKDISQLVRQILQG